jgi:predicted dienelactone hydrolase
MTTFLGRAAVVNAAMAAALVMLSCTSPAAGIATGYDPLAVPDDVAGPLSRVIDLDVVDDDRDRTIPIRVHLPTGPADSSDVAEPLPVVLFSHGLGGSREGPRFLAEHWSARGYVAVFLQHPGSDTAVWRDEEPGRRLAAMREAASLKNFQLRVWDVPRVLDQLEAWNRAAGHPLAGRLDLGHVGMSGHSFGAQTTQAVSGQSFPLIGRRFTDDRIKAAVIMSPGSPQGRRDPRAAFADVTIPWLLMTGTKDTALIGGQSVESRLAVFPALPPGGKYELVLHDAEHSVFSDRPLPGDRERRNPAHHRAILALSTAFWDVMLLGDPAARAWLDGDGPQHLLDQDDRWQTK